MLCYGASVGDSWQNAAMASIVCAFCDVKSNMTPMWATAKMVRVGLGADGRPASAQILQAIAECANCGRMSMGVALAGASGVDYKAQFAASRDIEWFPKTGQSPEVEDVPEHIAAAAKEAYACASINARMASILMSRTVVEATAKAKGITNGRLVQKIDELAAQDFIRESTKEAAHEIRHFGNDMAHGDIDTLPSEDDVQEVLALMSEVLNEVFQGPARVARIKAKREGTA
jgi:hypothetical protein